MWATVSEDFVALQAVEATSATRPPSRGIQSICPRTTLPRCCHWLRKDGTGKWELAVGGNSGEGRWACGGTVSVYEVGWKKAPEEADGEGILPLLLVPASPVSKTNKGGQELKQ